ncbi:MAG: M20/M25/M40 family metallo-hydrolase [Alphaproteobacteria bacterium]
MTDVRAYATELQATLPEILATVEKVVSIDSGTYHAAGVNGTIDVWAGLLKEIGFTVERTPLAGRGDQMTATMTIGNGPRLLILGHADTVWPAETTKVWPYGRAGDRIVGPGVGDMKSGVVTCLYALRMLLKRGDLAGMGSITMLIVPDEEIGSPQSRGWIEGHAKNADVCLTLEPCRPNGGVVIGRGAVGAAYIRATGVTAHAGSSREKGASAIAALAAIVGDLEALTSKERGVGVTVGIFNGGEARQVVPGIAELHLDMRATDDATAAAVLDEVKAIVARPPADSRVKLEVTGGFGRPAFPTHDGTKRLYALAEEFCGQIGAPLHAVVSPGGSDGSFAAALGVPTIDGLGPITHDTCSRNEYVEVSSIPQRGALLAGLIAATAAGRVPARA